MTPFQALYGRKPPSLLDYLPGDSLMAEVDTVLQTKKKIINDRIKETLRCTRQQHTVATFESPHSPDVQVNRTWKVELNTGPPDQLASLHSNSNTVRPARTHSTQETNRDSSPPSAPSESTPFATNMDVHVKFKTLPWSLRAMPFLIQRTLIAQRATFILLGPNAMLDHFLGSRTLLQGKC